MYVDILTINPEFRGGKIRGQEIGGGGGLKQRRRCPRVGGEEGNRRAGAPPPPLCRLGGCPRAATSIRGVRSCKLLLQSRDGVGGRRKPQPRGRVCGPGAARAAAPAFRPSARPGRWRLGEAVIFFFFFFGAAGERWVGGRWGGPVCVPLRARALPPPRRRPEPHKRTGCC